jgi:predicted nucleic acid-binding protein
MIQIDTNLFEDAVRKRTGWKSSSAVISWVKRGDIEGGVSAWTVATIYYFRRRLGTDDSQARQKTGKVLKGFAVLDLTAKVVNAALPDKRFSDFEDALQFHTAEQNGVDTIVTRNVKHFGKVKDEIAVLTPEEFLARKKVAKS